MVSRNGREALLYDVRTLFDTGTIGGLTDGELLGRLSGGSGRDVAAGPAFAALVDRHGPMVLRVCRSLLRDQHDAEDAFQATFLVLVRRAGSVRRQESVGSWLHGVALRIAAHARADLARRRRHERHAGALTLTADYIKAEGISPDAAATLHEELGQLPEHYRAAIVLCYLEGHTCEAAANRLGWPVGTVKSRLARGRKRLRGRLLRRGMAPDEASEPVEEVRGLIIPAALAHTTVEAMLRFAGTQSVNGVASATSLSWTLHTLRTMQMTRLAMISAVLILGVVVTGTAILAGPRRETPQNTPAAFEKTTAQSREPGKPAVPDDQVEMLIVRVVNHSGRDVADALVKVVEVDAAPADDGPGYRTSAYRTGANGRARIAVDRRFSQVAFESRPDDRTRGWASLHSGRLLPKATDEDPATLTLLPCNHQVEGTIVDTRGKPIAGVQVRAVVFNHDKNGFATDYGNTSEFSLASAVTDESGHYRLTSLPEATTATFRAYHPRFVGPTFSCKPDVQSIPSVTLEDAGRIAGTLVDGTTGQPVAGAIIAAQRIEHTERILNGNSGSAVSDSQGHFKADGLASGVYNVLLQSSPKGRRFTARAVEGVRVKAGEDAQADLRLIAGRRVHGTARTGRTDKPMVATPIFCYSESHPRSGAACQGTYTDLQGRFEHFVPPGIALVYIAEPGQFGQEYRQILNVPDDRDPDPVSLKQGDDPNTKQPPGGSAIVKCDVRVRVKMDAGDRPASKQDRNLNGRVFGKGAAPLVGVQVYHNGQPFKEAATDRMGVFRLSGLPHGPLMLGLRRNQDQQGWMRIPGEAAEVDVIIPE